MVEACDNGGRLPLEPDCDSGRNFALEMAGAAAFEHDVPYAAGSFRFEGVLALLGYERAQLPLSAQDLLTWICQRLSAPQRHEVLAAYGAFLQGQRPHFALEVRVRHTRGHWLWCTVVAKAARRDAQGQPTRVIGAIIDATDHRKLQDRERLLAAEVDHRAKNVLAAVQSMIRLTAAKGLPRHDLIAKLTHRIQALARAHDKLAESHWEGASLREVIAGEAQAGTTAMDRRIFLQGTDLTLLPRAVQTLGLVLHELTLNSSRHGALSTPHGEVYVSWRRRRNGDRSELHLEWMERGGPPISEPGPKGFGTLVMERAVGHELGAVGKLEFAEGGLRYTLDIPLTELVAQAEDVGGEGADDKGKYPDC